MLIAEPPQTPWDVHFSVFGFPVRIHPLFWLVGMLLGFSGGKDAGIHLLIWFVAFFSSILIHELGHALMIRRFGRPAHIVLYAMGGLAIEGRPSAGFGSPWSFDSYTGFQPRQRTPVEQILISAAGPGIQFLLLGLIVAVIFATGGAVAIETDGLMASVWVPFTSESKEAIASYPEIQKELRLALQAVGRKLGMSKFGCNERINSQSLICFSSDRIPIAA